MDENQEQADQATLDKDKSAVAKDQAAVDKDKESPPAPPVVPAPSPVVMSPDDYSAAISKERTEALDAKDAAMKARHAAETDVLAKRQAAEVAALASEREQLKAEMDAVKLYAEMWKRQADEDAIVSPNDQAAQRLRHAAEAAKLARDTGNVITQPMLGGRTRPGFATPLPGHPWVRPVAI